MPISKGRIVANFRRFAGAGTTLEGMTGTAYITPSIPTMTWPGEGITAVQEQLRCPIIGGVLYPPGTPTPVPEGTEPGVLVVASQQPDATEVLVTYGVTVAFVHATLKLNTQTPIEVPAGGHADLASLLDVTFPPGTIVVANSADRLAAEQAATAALETLDAIMTIANMITGLAAQASTASRETLANADAARHAQTGAEVALERAQDASALARSNAEAALLLREWVGPDGQRRSIVLIGADGYPYLDAIPSAT